MANQICLSFEFNRWDEIDGINSDGFASIISSVKRSGNYALQIFGKVWYVSIPLVTPVNEIYAQIPFYVNGLDVATSDFIKWVNFNEVLGGVRIHELVPTLDFYTGNMITKVHAGNVKMNSYVWNTLELHILIATNGIVEARLEGVPLFRYEGNTIINGVTTINCLLLSAASCYTVWDDIVINDTTGTYNNSWPGGLKFVYLPVNGDFGPNDWTPSSGTSHTNLVDEVVPDTADNLVATSSNLVERFTLTDLPIDAHIIKLIKPCGWMSKSSENSPSKVSLGIDLNGTNHYSSALELSLDQSLISTTIESDPDGGVITPAKVNNAKISIKSMD